MNAIGGTLVTQCQYTWLYITKRKNLMGKKESKIENKRTHLHGQSVTIFIGHMVNKTTR